MCWNRHNFKIKITYETVYQCGINNYSTTASTTQTINAVPASAIYGTIQNTTPVGIDNTTTCLYLKNINNNNVYKIPVKNGHFLFFAQPNTEYKVYNRNFNQIYTVNASNLTYGNVYPTLKYFTSTGSPLLL